MQRRQIIILVLCLLIPSLFLWQNVMELRAEEPRRAIVSLEMLLTGEWIVPHINGWPYYNKPPFFNWIMAFFFWLFQSFDEWVVRFPSLLSACIHAWLIYSISKKYLKKESAMLAGFIYITAGEILFFGSITSGEIDLFFSLITFLQVYSIYKFSKLNNLFALFLFSYFLAAIGFLTKGLPAVAFQGLTLLAWLIFQGKWKSLFSFQHIAGGSLFLLITGTYFYLFSQQDDAIGFIVRQYKEAAMRTGLETEATSTWKGALLFLPNFFKLLLPWSLFLLLSAKGIQLIKQNNSFISFWLIFIIVNIPIYWISGDFKARYYYVFMAAISIIIAELIYYGLENQKRTYSNLRGLILVISITIPFACLIGLLIELPFTVNHLALRLILFLVLSSATAYLFYRSKDWIWSLVLILVVARVGFNLFYLPAWQADKTVAYYRESIDEILEITNGQQIAFLGEPYVFTSDASIGPLKLKEVSLTTAPLMNYRIPYYFSRATKEVMQFHTERELNTYYLIRSNHIDTSEVKVLFTLFDNWQQQEYVLFYSDDSANSSDLGNNTNQEPAKELIARAK